MRPQGRSATQRIRPTGVVKAITTPDPRGADVPRTTPRRLAIAGVLAALAVAAAPAAAQPASPSCTAKEGDTIARNSTTRVFMRTTGTIDDGQDVRVYSCRLHTRTAILTTRFRNDLDGSLRVEEAILGS